MKRVCLLLALVFPASAFSQNNCEGYFPDVKGLQLEYRLSNAKGKVSLIRHQMVQQVEVKTAGLEVSAEIINSDVQGKEKSRSIAIFNCLGDQTMMGIDQLAAPQGMVSNMALVITGDGFRLPNTPVIGQKLPPSVNVVKVKRGNFVLTSIQYTIHDYQVDSQEMITTPAGIFDCYKLTYWVDSKRYAPGSSLMKYNAIFSSIRVVQWYAKQIGLIKEEVYKKNGKLFSSTQLTQLTR
jgi:hypothetical protein